MSATRRWGVERTASHGRPAASSVQGGRRSASGVRTASSLPSVVGRDGEVDPCQPELSTAHSARCEVRHRRRIEATPGRPLRARIAGGSAIGEAAERARVDRRAIIGRLFARPSIEVAVSPSAFLHPFARPAAAADEFVIDRARRGRPGVGRRRARLRRRPGQPLVLRRRSRPARDRRARRRPAAGARAFQYFDMFTNEPAERFRELVSRTVAAPRCTGCSSPRRARRRSTPP